MSDKSDQEFKSHKRIPNNSNSADPEKGKTYREKKYPILEFDDSSPVINPENIVSKRDVPEYAVICFFQEVIANLKNKKETRLVTNLKSEIGLNPVYEIKFQDKNLLVFHPGVGAPLAAALLEEVIVLGASKFIACGGAGVLDEEIQVGKLVVPTAAVRDEGTSYHYLPPAREVSASKEGLAAIEKVLKKHSCDYLLAKTWTTDSYYRETVAKVQQRKKEGCLTVDMEASAFFAVARHRGVTLAQILYGGDDVSCEEWDSRNWADKRSIREEVFWLAVEACLEM